MLHVSTPYEFLIESHDQVKFIYNYMIMFKATRIQDGVGSFHSIPSVAEGKFRELIVL